MKIKYFFHRNTRVAVTFLMTVALFLISYIASYYISKIEEEKCWDELNRAVKMLDRDMQTYIRYDQEVLDSIASLIAAQDKVESPQVQHIIDEFKPENMIYRIGILLPDNRVMMQNQPIQDASGILNYIDEAAKGKHVSNRSVSIMDENDFVLRNFVPVRKDGKTIAMLFGIIDLKELPYKIKSNAYDGNAATYVIDSKTGEFIVDTWHKQLSDAKALGDRQTKQGYDINKMQEDPLRKQSGTLCFCFQNGR